MVKVNIGIEINDNDIKNKKGLNRVNGPTDNNNDNG